MSENKHADGNWTTSKYSTFIRNQLRRGWVKWPVKNSLLKEARVERGKYLCTCCGDIVPSTMKVPGKTVEIKKVKGVNVDHILPATPLTGQYVWDDFIHRLYCERDNLWVICYHCHDYKTQKVEKALIKALKQLQKGEDPFPLVVGQYKLTGLTEPYNGSEDITFKMGRKKIHLYEILRTNGGIKKGEA